MFLSPAQLRELTGKRRSDAQARVLDFMRIPYSTRLNGTIAVLRAVAERALGGTGTIAASAEPELMP